MNAGNYRVHLNLSPITFPALIGLGMQSALTLTDPPSIVNSKLVLKITKTFLLTETATNKEHEVLKAKSVYKVPIKGIKTKEIFSNFTRMPN